MRSIFRAAVVASVVVSSAALAQGYTCVIDDLAMRWTGATRIVDGKLLKEWVCVRNHRAWAP